MALFSTIIFYCTALNCTIWYRASVTLSTICRCHTINMFNNQLRQSLWITSNTHTEILLPHGLVFCSTSVAKEDLLNIYVPRGKIETEREYKLLVLDSIHLDGLLWDLFFWDSVIPPLSSAVQPWCKILTSDTFTLDVIMTAFFCLPWDVSTWHGCFCVCVSGCVY